MIDYSLFAVNKQVIGFDNSIYCQISENRSPLSTIRFSRVYWWRYYIWKGTSMSISIILIAFILLIIGTIGLLINEIIFNWGRCVTLTFAIINVVGLASLAFEYWAKKKRP